MIRYPVEEMIALYKELDGSHAEIARHMGCTRELVRQKLSKRGYGATGLRQVSETRELVEKLEKMEASGFSRKEAAHLLGYSYDGITLLLKKSGVKLRDEREDPGQSKNNLIALYDECNGNYSEMARSLGTYPSCISKKMKKLNLNESHPAKKGRPCKK